MTAPKAIKAFYGARAHDARKNTVKAHISPGERPQEVFTPETVLEILYRAWGSIALDPCGHPDALVTADEVWTGIKVDTGRSKPTWDGPGLRQPWRDRTYWNPPFCDLEAWIRHALYQPERWCGLFPARTHRTWCLEALRAGAVDGVCWLRPVTFEGYDQANPDRLVLAYRGPDVRAVAAVTPPELGTWTRPLEDL